MHEEICEVAHLRCFRELKAGTRLLTYITCQLDSCCIIQFISHEKEKNRLRDYHQLGELIRMGMGWGKMIRAAPGMHLGSDILRSLH